MSVDNYNQISNLLDWSEDGTFFMLQILKRRKDQSEGDNQKSDNVCIKDYYIKSASHFEKIYPEIVKLCGFFNARAYIRLNKIFWDKAAMETLVITVEYLQKGNSHNVKSAFATACGRRCYDPNKKWIIDIDEKPFDVDNLRDKINAYRPEGDKVIAEIPTKNGIHLIVRPFDARDFKVDFPEVDIHKCNPTLLYCP